ncbi:MAG: hypothetical protein GY941_23210 [Planctomycetes bacterium]|nr:hypothetical protein [Planctomycetota bacterium]
MKSGSENRKTTCDEYNILLVNDYFGSGHTLSEACRVLRKVTLFKGEIIPLTVAKVRWKLGAPGMI